MSIRASQAAITAAFQATTWWQTQAAPGDFASGTASTSWAPVVTALGTAAASSWPVAHRAAVYAHLCGLIRQNIEQARTTTGLGPSERRDSMAYGAALLTAYEAFGRPGALTV